MDNNNNQNNNSKMPKNAQVIIAWVVTFLIAVAGLSYLHNALSARTTEELSYDTFMNMVDEKQVEAVSVEDSRITIEPKSTWEGYMPGKTYYTVRMDNDLTLAERLRTAGVDTHRIRKDGNFIIQTIVSYLLLFGLMGILLNFMMRRVGGGGGIMGVGKSNAKVYVQKETGVTFRDVAGEDEAKESLTEIVDFLHNPGKYTKIGAKLPKGALLVGPPGTGKTLLAKAVAGEAHVPFYSLSGSDFVEMFVGVGASRVRDLFKQAQESAPCIIFIDEVDAIGKSRDSRFGGGNDEREQTLNQLLSEMDGFDSSKGLLVLAATNRPEILDPALLRPGRFDRRIIVDKPDLKGRVDILKVHSRDVLMDESVDLDAIALATSGAVGSDLANMINEAAINAVKEGREFVSQKDLFNAVEVVLVGKEKKDRIMSKEERKIVSYHEVGHALVSALQKNSEPVQKITIVPRTMGALGYVMHVPEDEKYLNSKNELHDMIVGLLGGRAAEEIVFDTVTTGASNDIEKATGIARSMITRYGMSEKFGLMGLETVESQYLDGRSALNCADNTAAEIDTEVMNMLKACYEEALGLLRENREVMDQIAAHLIEKETITGKEFMKIYREAKGLPEPEEKTDETGDLNEKKSEVQETGRTDDVQEEAPIPDAVQQPAFTAQQPEEQGSRWSMPPAYDWDPARMQQGSMQNPGQEHTAQQCQNVQPQNPVQQPYQNVQQQGHVPPQPQRPYPFQDPQMPQNVSLPEDNGDHGETSRFGSVWDRNVNGNRDSGNQNGSNNRW